MKKSRISDTLVTVSRRSTRAGPGIIRGLGLLLVLLLAALSVLPVLAASYDLSTPWSSATINGAIFLQWYDPSGAGTGNFDPFLRIQANGTERGYNTDGTLEFDTKTGLWTHALLLSTVPTVSVGGTEYREFQLDINEAASTPLLSLDELQLFTAISSNLTGYSAGPPPSIGGATTLVYNLDTSGDNTVTLNYLLNNGSGWADYLVLVPDSSFGSDPNCAYGGTGCTTYVYLYSRFGDTHASDNGFEEWAVGKVSAVFQPGTIIVEKQTDPDGAPDSFTFSGDAAGTISDGQKIVVSGLQPGTYTSQETVPTGWDLTSIVCDDDNSSGDVNTGIATFRLEAGETVKCTFTNEKPTATGSLDVTKTVNWGKFPVDPSQTFEICIIGPSCPTPGCCMTIDYDGGTLSWSGLLPGDYTITETDPGTGWKVEISGSPATVPANGIATATVTNTREKPTAITLVSFTAQAGAGGVTLAWETGTELDNAGFNLYRALLQDGPYTQINAALIPAEGDAASGASYSFVDTPDYGTFYYKLEDVDYNGLSTFHGPVRVTVARPLLCPLYRPTPPEF